MTHSSGNHGQAVALAARLSGIPADVVVPLDTAQCKVDAIEAYGGAHHPPTRDITHSTPYMHVMPVIAQMGAVL